MEPEKSLVSGSMSLLVLKLLEGGDLYGYQMIAELRRRSDDTFRLKAGTLYPPPQPGGKGVCHRL